MYLLGEYFWGYRFPKLVFWVKGHELFVDLITHGQIALSKDYQFIEPS